MFYKKNQSKKLNKQLFFNPTSEYRGTPFWAWNCKMDIEILDEQIEYLNEMGFGGFHMHSRTGMAVPYLGEEFMNLVKFCTNKAKSKNMLAYLYDEDRWPSGTAGGFVTRNPRYRARYIEFSLNKESHFPMEEALNEGKPYLLCVFDIVLNENGELLRYQHISPNDKPLGTKWYVYVKTPEESPWFNNQTYVDTLSKEAVDEFIKITYNAYKNAVGDEFSKTIPSIFTDEPQFTLKQPLGCANSMDSAIFPWTMSFRESFSKNYNYDILDRLPEIVWNLPDGKISTARYHYHNHTAEMFAQSFADNCGKWCDEHKIALTGHVLEEPTLQSQTSALGEAMRPYRAFAIPGIDMLCNRIEFSTAKQCQSVVHQHGREAMLCELYGVTNWDFDFRGHKFQGDWLAALGVTIRVPHLSWVSMAGEAKRDYPASINYQSPWYKEYKYIEDHFARINTALTRGKPIVKIAVIHPIESYWINLGPDQNTFDVRTQLDKKFSDIIEWLLLGTIDFDFISESLLPSMLKETNGKLCVGVMEYDAVVVPDCITIRSSTLEMLKQFNISGGKIIFVGQCPKYVDAITDTSVYELYNKSVIIPFDKIELLNSLEEYRTVKIINQNGSLTSNFIYNMREDNSCKWLFIAHGSFDVCDPTFIATSTKEYTTPQNIKIIIYGEYHPTLYNTLDGKIYNIKYEIKDGQTIIDWNMYSNDSILLNLSYDLPHETNFKSAAQDKPSKIIRFKEKVRLTRFEPNVLLLDRAEYSLNEEPFNTEEEILILDNICRKKMGWPLRSDVFAQPWVIDEEKTVNYITLKFSINSEIYVKDAFLSIEDAEKLQITLNNETVCNEINGWYVDKSIKTVSLPEIKKGLNELIVKLPFGKRTNTEWCYILGDFGVKTEGCFSTIIEPNTHVGFSSLTNQGLPFYGGNVSYKTNIHTPDCYAIICANYFRGALIKVLVDGEEKGIIAFAPYHLKIDEMTKGNHTIEFILYGNRINTFGGMHNISQPKWVGPNFWRSEGDQWCYEYILKDTGILASPIIEIYENSTNK